MTASISAESGAPVSGPRSASIYNFLPRAIDDHLLPVIVNSGIEEDGVSVKAKDLPGSARPSDP